MLRLLPPLAITLLLSSCIVSDLPMLPAHSIPEAAPIKPGYYVMRERETDGGNSIWSADEIPIIVRHSYGKYSVDGESKLKDLPNSQIFGPVGTSTYVGQGRSDGKYYYAKIGAADGNFAAYINTCGEMHPMTARSLMSLNYMAIKERFCVFSDALSLIDSLGNDGKIWRSFKTEFFSRRDGLASNPQDLNPRLLYPITSGCSVVPPVAPAPVFGEVAQEESKGRHLSLVSKSVASNYSSELAVLLEAIGSKVQGYAWIVPWSNQDGKIVGCSPKRLVKISQTLPKSNLFDLPNSEAAREAIRVDCRREALGQPCGPADEVISIYERRRLKILLQGFEVLRFPDGKTMPGSAITVMANPGNTSALIVLVTYIGQSGKAGLTRVLEERNL